MITLTTIKKIIAIVTTLPISLYANNIFYECEVKYVGDVNDSGITLSVKKNSKNFLSPYIDSKFSVNKINGGIKGEIISNAGPYTVSTQILDIGGGDNSFKILSIFGPNTSVLYLQINDFADLKNKPIKTFSGFRWSEPVSGICR